MLSWLRRFPNDVIHRKGRRTTSSTSWRNKSNSFTARIIRCASSVVETHQHRGGDDDDDDDDGDDYDDCRLPSSPPPAPINNKRNTTTTSVISARAFSFRELADAAGNFRQDNLIGEGGFGRVYKARLPTIAADDDADLQGLPVAIKQLDRNGFQGNNEFMVEVLMLSMLHHPNLVSLVGYCAEGEQRLLVYEYMPLGSLEDHLLLRDHDDGGDHGMHGPLPWRTRMKIALGAARGLEYLHESAVIYRDLKSSNILLDQDYAPKLSDFGLAKLLPAPRTDSSSSSSSSSGGGGKVMGTYGYCAPEYLRTGKLSAKSDVYSFGVLLLELITGRRAIDASRPDGEQSLVGWAAGMFGDSTRFHELLDPRLVMAMRGRPTASQLKQAVGVASMCLQEHHALRPVMTDVVMALSFIAADSPSPPCC